MITLLNATLGKEYLVEDITEFVREKGIDV